MKDISEFENKIICGDCLEVMKDIPDNSIDCVITDPPYGIEYFSNRYKYGNPHMPIKNDDRFEFPLGTLWKKLKNHGVLFVFHSHKIPFIDNHIKNEIVWVKNNWTAGDLACDFGNQYECISFIPKQKFRLHSKRYSNVWFFDRVRPIYHPTQKPINLIKRIIECSTNESDIILDPFLGSGTTAVACKQLNRHFIGIEINPEYCKIAEDRLKNTIIKKNDIKNEKFW